MKRRSRKHACSQKPNHTTKFIAGPSFQCSYQWASTYPKNITWLTYSSSICYTLHLTTCASYFPKWNASFTRCYRPGKLTEQALYRVSQEECARLREGVPYVKVYRYNPKHLCPKLNGYGDTGQRKVWSSGGSTHCQLTTLSMSVLECGVILQQFRSSSL